MNRPLALFDFDKTLVRSDSFRLFSEMNASTAWRRLYVFGLAVAYKAGCFDNGTYKQKVLEAVWDGKSQKARKQKLQEFFSVLGQLTCERTDERLRTHLTRGDHVAILSASPLFYLRPFAHQQWSQDIVVHGSHAFFEGGRRRVDAFYGETKSVLARALIDEYTPSQVWVYTDHFSDLPLIELADHIRLVNPSRKLQRAVEQRGFPFEVVSC